MATTTSPLLIAERVEEDNSNIIGVNSKENMPTFQIDASNHPKVIDSFEAKTEQIYKKEKQIFKDLAKNDHRVPPMFDYVIGEDKGNIITRPAEEKVSKYEAQFPKQPFKVQSKIPYSNMQRNYGTRSKIYTEEDLNQIMKRVEEKRKETPNSGNYITDKELNEVIDQYYLENPHNIPTVHQRSEITHLRSLHETDKSAVESNNEKIAKESNTKDKIETRNVVATDPNTKNALKKKTKADKDDVLNMVQNTSLANKKIESKIDSIPTHIPSENKEDSYGNIISQGKTSDTAKQYPSTQTVIHKATIPTKIKDNEGARNVIAEMPNTTVPTVNILVKGLSALPAVSMDMGSLFIHIPKDKLRQLVNNKEGKNDINIDLRERIFLSNRIESPREENEFSKVEVLTSTVKSWASKNIITPQPDLHFESRNIQKQSKLVMKTKNSSNVKDSTTTPPNTKRVKDLVTMYTQSTKSNPSFKNNLMIHPASPLYSKVASPKISPITLDGGKLSPPHVYNKPNPFENNVSSEPRNIAVPHKTIKKIKTLLGISIQTTPLTNTTSPDAISSIPASIPLLNRTNDTKSNRTHITLHKQKNKISKSALPIFKQQQEQLRNNLESLNEKLMNNGNNGSSDTVHSDEPNRSNTDINRNSMDHELDKKLSKINRQLRKAQDNLDKLKNNNIKDKTPTIQSPMNSSSINNVTDAESDDLNAHLAESRSANEEPKKIRGKNGSFLHAKIFKFNKNLLQQQTNFDALKKKDLVSHFPPAQMVKLTPNASSAEKNAIPALKLLYLGKQLAHEWSKFSNLEKLGKKFEPDSKMSKLQKQLLKEQSDLTILKNFKSSERVPLTPSEHQANKQTEAMLTTSKPQKKTIDNAVANITTMDISFGPDMKGFVGNSVNTEIKTQNTKDPNKLPEKIKSDNSASFVKVNRDSTLNVPVDSTNSINSSEVQVEEIKDNPLRSRDTEDVPKEFHEQFHKNLVHPTTETPPEQQPVLNG